MKLVVGLGNPGREYENTRHNIGYMVLKKLGEKYKLDFSKNKFKGSYSETTINNEKYLFLLPEKYMNLSGEVVKDFVNYYKIDIDNILIISDDLDMPTGKIKLKANGSSGKSSLPTGMTVGMRKSGGRPGRISRTDTWKLLSVRSASV